jgi:hypothetical protein
MLEAPTLGGVWESIFPSKPYPCNNAARTQDLLAPVGRLHHYTRHTSTEIKIAVIFISSEQ